MDNGITGILVKSSGLPIFEILKLTACYSSVDESQIEKITAQVPKFFFYLLTLGRGVGRGSGGVKRALDTSGSKNDSVSDKLSSTSSTVNPPKRRGRPPLYPQTSPSSTVPSSEDNTVSSVSVPAVSLSMSRMCCL